MTKHKKNTRKNSFNSNEFFEAEVVEGLEDIAIQELAVRLGKSPDDFTLKRGAIQFQFNKKLEALDDLHSVTAIYSLQHYDIPRPKALLGHQHFTQLAKQIMMVIERKVSGEFQNFHLSAAGSHTSVMQRIKDAIQSHTGLKHHPEQGDLLIRIRRDQQADRWETLVRLTSRPLVTRQWRVQDMPGALNASVAYAMVHLSRPLPTDIVFNPGCGSGTLLIERLNHTPSRFITGCDLSLSALAAAQSNITASGYNDRINIICANVSRLSMKAQIADKLYADLPFGQLSGSHQENQTLYPTLLTEAARIAKPGARFVLITHEIKLIQKTIHENPNWILEEERMVNLRGLHPRIYVLVRKGS